MRKECLLMKGALHATPKITPKIQVKDTSDEIKRSARSGRSAGGVCCAGIVVRGRMTELSPCRPTRRKAHALSVPRYSKVMHALGLQFNVGARAAKG